MSTKIFNGYILPKTFKTLDQAINWSHKLQTKFESTCTPRLVDVIARDATKMIDQVVAHKVLKLGKLGVKSPQFRKRCHYSRNNPFALAFDNAEEGLQESPLYCLRDYFTLSITLLRSRKRTLCLIFGGNPCVEEWFEKNSGAQPFPYWDNTNQPEGMSRGQWKARGKIWEAALPNNAAPAQAGLSINSKEATHYIWNVKGQIPTAPNRIHRARHSAEFVLSCLESLKYTEEERINKSYMIYEAVRTQKRRLENITALLLPHLPELPSWKIMEKHEVETYEITYENNKPKKLEVAKAKSISTR